MSASTEAPKPTVENVPESPTTVRPLDLDDDDVQETPGLNEESTQKPSATTPSSTTAPTATEEAAPPKPPRPMTEQQKNVQVLKEAFPTVEESVIKAVLRASSGRVEPAFNALLEMTDPDAVQNEEQPPPPPPRPVADPLGASSTPQTQLEADEQYARQLAQHYDNVGAYEARTSSRSGPGGGAYPPRPRQQTGLKPNEMYDDKEHSFLDDDLPVIRDNLRKGFLETQTKVNSWFNDLKKKINEEFNEEDDERHQQRTNVGPRQGGDRSRRSGDYDRYDADPELLSDDFAGMRFHQDGTPAGRPVANPNLFRPPASSPSPKPGSERKVAFRDSVDDIDAYGASPKLPPKDNQNPGDRSASPAGASAKASKWQPLSTVEPSPIAENDPFSLGDSEDEKDAATSKDKRSGSSSAGGGGEIKMEDAERLRQAAAEAMADSIVDDQKKDTSVAAAAAKKE